MKSIACVFAAVVACLAGCQRDRDHAAAAVPEAYRADIENLCDAIARSGADQRPADEHALVIATWLGSHLTTDEAHQYLVQIQPLEGEPKAAALDAEAHRVGLARCALAAAWRAPH
jgi:hypothetical protein